MQTIRCKVLNLEISEMSGSKYGNILVEDIDGNRYDLKYDANSTGAIPQRESFVIVTYNESSLNRIVEISDLPLDQVPTQEKTSGIKLVLNPFNLIIMIPLVLTGGLTVLMSLTHWNLVGTIFLLVGGLGLISSGIGVVLKRVTYEVYKSGMTSYFATLVGWGTLGTAIPLEVYGLLNLTPLALI